MCHAWQVIHTDVCKYDHNGRTIIQGALGIYLNWPTFCVEPCCGDRWNCCNCHHIFPGASTQQDRVAFRDRWRICDRSGRVRGINKQSSRVLYMALGAFDVCSHWAYSCGSCDFL